MEQGGVSSNLGVTVGTSSTQVFRGDDAQSYDSFEVTVTNNGGGTVTAAAFQVFDQVGGWVSVDADNCTAQLVPAAGGDTVNYSSIEGLAGHEKVRLMLTASQSLTVDVTVTPYRIGTRN